MSKIDIFSAFSSCMLPSHDCDHLHECPLNSKCAFSFNENGTTHLKTLHRAPEKTVPRGNDGVGYAEIEALIHARDNTIKRTAVLLRFGDDVFAWTLESRLRADAETQVSVTMQLVDDKPLPQTPETTRAGQNHKLFEGLLTTSTTKSYKISLWVEAPSSLDQDKLYWDTTLSSIKPLCRHERLISCNQGLVLLSLAHRDAFQPANDGQGGLKLIIHTKIEEL